jgi:hypothetical protein
MKHKVVIAVADKVFEFEGQIVEFDPDYLLLQAKHGEVYIERKHLVFIQFLDEEPVTQETMQPSMSPKNVKNDNAARLIKQRLKQDPLKEKLEKLIPPSQLPETMLEYSDPEDDAEVIRNVYGLNNSKTTNLQHAVKIAMDSDDDFSMDNNVKYRTPSQLLTGIKDARKKTRDSD